MIGLPWVAGGFNKQPVEAERLTSDRADARSLRPRGFFSQEPGVEVSCFTSLLMQRVTWGISSTYPIGIHDVQVSIIHFDTMFMDFPLQIL